MAVKAIHRINLHPMDSACAIGSPNTNPLGSGFLRWCKRHLAHAQLRPGPLYWAKMVAFFKKLIWDYHRVADIEFSTLG